MSHPIRRDEHGLPIDPIIAAAAEAVSDWAVSYQRGTTDALREALRDAVRGIAAIRVHRWLPPGPDPLTLSNWWAYREPCDCPDTSFGRNPHRWDCEQTPIYARTMRAGYLPTFDFGGKL